MPETEENAPETALYEKAEVVSIINSVLNKVALSQIGVENHIYQEILVLKDIIEDLRQDLRSAAPQDITRDHIPGATDELDAVIRLTDQATHSIMNACEAIEIDLNDLPSATQDKIRAHLTVILESCTFQDITGQRISKVVTALKKVDAKMQDVMAVLAPHLLDSSAHSSFSSRPVLDPADSLMNGPQLPGYGVTQDDVDRILGDLMRDQ